MGRVRLHMADNRLPKRAFNSKMQGKRPVEKPHKRREDAVTEDAPNMIGIRG